MTENGRSRPDANDRTVVERTDPLIGAVLDRRFHVDFRLAAGGFGAIYKATHLKSGHQVALKVLHRDMATDPRVVLRFRREGEALITLRDPHTITAYEIGEDAGGELYHRDGAAPRREPVRTLSRARSAAMETGRRDRHSICSSLAEAHARGIVHRDLKPANIHLEPRDGEPDFVKVLDFGIAKILNGGGENDADLTNAGQMIGTYDYMSPEQMVGDCTTRSDIYTLGVLMYEMICGVRPFDDVVGPTSLLAALITRAPPTLASRAKVPAELDRIVMHCLDKEPAGRYQDVHELQRDLHRLLLPSVIPEDEPTAAREVISFPTSEQTPTAQVDNDATWLHMAAPVMLTPGAGYTPVPGVMPTPTIPALAAAPPAPAPTPIFKPQQPPPLYPVSASVAPRSFPTPHTPIPQLQRDPTSGPVMYPAGAFRAAPADQSRPYPRAPTPWDGGTRPSQEIRPFDMSAATSRDAWLARVIWILVLVVGVVIGLILTAKL